MHRSKPSYTSPSQDLSTPLLSAHEPHNVGLSDKVPTQPVESDEASISAARSAGRRCTPIIPGKSAMPPATEYHLIRPYLTDKQQQETWRNSRSRKHARDVLSARLQLTSLAAQLGINDRGRFNNLEGTTLPHHEFAEGKGRLEYIHQSSILNDKDAKESHGSIPHHTFIGWSHPRRVPMQDSQMSAVTKTLRSKPEKKLDLDNFDPNVLDDHIKDLEKKMEYAHLVFGINFDRYF